MLNCNYSLSPITTPFPNVTILIIACLWIEIYLLFANGTQTDRNKQTNKQSTVPFTHTGEGNLILINFTVYLVLHFWSINPYWTVVTNSWQAK